MIFLLLTLISFPSNASVLRVAHRGAPAFAPENTMASFRKAIELKADYLETDVQQTKDKVLVIMHDSSVDRTTNGKGKVGELTFAELEKMDAGQGEKIPTLENVLSLGVSNQSIKFILELKDGNDVYPGIEEALVEMVKKNLLEDRVVFKSFSYPMLERLRKLAPKIPQIYVFFTAFPKLGITIDHRVRFHNPFDLKVEFLQAHERLTAFNFVVEAHAHGKKVIIWGVEDQEKMKTWTENQVDGIETDHLDLLNSNK